jgi:beta-lactamase class D
VKKAVLFLCGTILFASNAFAKQCFISKEGDEVIQEKGDCGTRYAPCSTFKIPLSLIGFDSEIFIDEANPVWKFKKGYADKLDVWKQDQTPQSWMKYSCIWYSQVMTKELGMKKFQKYVNQFDYGNKDLSGDYAQNNGLTNSWLSSSLEISSNEQIAFLEKFFRSCI